MTLLLTGLLLVLLLASIPLLRLLQRRPTTPELVARALVHGLRFFWIGFAAGLALGLLALIAGDALAPPLLPFLAIAAGGGALLVSFLVSANLGWLRLGRAARRRQPAVVRFLPLLTAIVVAAVVMLGLRPLIGQRALAAARSPQTTGPELRALFLERPRDQRLIAEIARHPAASPELVAEMARSGYAALYVLAFSPKLPPELLRELAADELPLRQNVASNPALPETLMRRLLADPVPAVRAALAANRAVPAQMLRTLAGDPESSVRQAVAANARAPTGLLHEIAAGPDPASAAAAERTLWQRAQGDRPPASD